MSTQRLAAPSRCKFSASSTFGIPRPKEVISDRCPESSRWDEIALGLFRDIHERERKEEAGKRGVDTASVVAFIGIRDDDDVCDVHPFAIEEMPLLHGRLEIIALPNSTGGKAWPWCLIFLF